MRKPKNAKTKGRKSKPASSKQAKARKAKPSKPRRSAAAPQAVTPYLAIRNAAAAITFYRRVFDARERMRLADPSGRIGHAEIEIRGMRIMLADEFPEMDVRGPEAFGGSPVSIHLYVTDVDAVFARAVAAGARPLREPADQFYGDRAATVIDPFGHRWFLATRKAKVSPKELTKRYAAILKA